MFAVFAERLEVKMKRQNQFIMIPACLLGIYTYWFGSGGGFLTDHCVSNQHNLFHSNILIAQAVRWYFTAATSTCYFKEAIITGHLLRSELI